MNGLLLTHVWDVNDQNKREFAEKFSAIPVDRYDDMIDTVDAIMISEVWSIDVWPKLAKPYLEAGLPIFFNRPFASSMRDAKEIVPAFKKIRRTDLHTVVMGVLFCSRRHAA